MTIYNLSGTALQLSAEMKLLQLSFLRYFTKPFKDNMPLLRVLITWSCFLQKKKKNLSSTTNLGNQKNSFLVILNLKSCFVPFHKTLHWLIKGTIFKIFYTSKLLCRVRKFLVALFSKYIPNLSLFTTFTAITLTPPIIISGPRLFRRLLI